MSEKRSMAQEYARRILKKMAQGGIAKEDQPEEETLGKKIGYPGFSEGGMIEDDIYDLGHAMTEDTAGEPHTEDEEEEKHGMEYMSAGGKVAFAKALRKHGGYK